MGQRSYLGEFEQVVLLSIARLGRTAYGMAIHQEILQTTGRDVSVPGVYVTLERLRDKGLISAQESPPPAGGRVRRFYMLSDQGLDALERSRSLFDRLWEGVELGTLRQNSEG